MKLNSCLAAFAALGLTSSLYACGTDSYVGTICTTAANFCPSGTLEANGQILAISSNTALFSLLGTYYGGNGTTTFALPDLRGRTAVGSSTSGGTGTSPISLGEMRGQESVTLTVNQMPTHTHTLSGATLAIPVSSNTAGNKLMPDGDYSYMAGTAGGPAGAAMWTNTMTAPVNVKGTAVAGSVTPSGGSLPVSILPPQLGMKQCIVAQGIYPSRP